MVEGIGVLVGLADDFDQVVPEYLLVPSGVQAIEYGPEDHGTFGLGLHYACFSV